MKFILKTTYISVILFLFCPAIFANNNNEIQEITDTAILILQDDPVDNDKIKLKFINLQIDPVGILFYGPQVGVDLQIADFLTIGPTMHWNYAGLSYRRKVGVYGLFEDKEVSLNSMSYGVSVKLFVKSKTGRHRGYFRFDAEGFNGSEYEDGDSRGKHIFEHKARVYHFGGGYRLSTNSFFNLSIGGFITKFDETKNIDFYEGDKRGTLQENDLLSEMYVGIQVVLGFQFGK